MQIIPNYRLKNLNSFGIDAKAAFFAEIECEQDLFSFLAWYELHKMSLQILGGGSNILFTKDFDGCVVYVNHKGIELIDENDESVFIEVAAGENWDDLISYCIEHNYGGLENLSGIPGKVGSSPIQNIGAYGVEVKDSIFCVHTIDLEDGLKRVFRVEACGLGYRESVFKNALKGKVLIEKVVYKLSKHAVFNLSYKGVEEEVKRVSGGEVTIKAVREAIKNIRNSKIPDTNEVGSAGSFFKNPIISKAKMEELVARFPDIAYHKVDEEHFKPAAAWMIEQCGWKGFREGDAGVNDKQALILVNYGEAKGEEILKLGLRIQESVMEKFGIGLEMEVGVV